MPRFQEAAVAPLPKIACIGTVEVLEGKLASTGYYVVQNFKLHAAGPKGNMNVNVLYKPHWLEVGFDAKADFAQYENASSLEFVWSKNISSADKTKLSNLKGIAGSEAAFTELQGALLLATDKSITGIEQVFRDFINKQNEESPSYVGYVLTQKQEKVTDADGNFVKDENGKQVYALTPNYEVGRWFFVDQDNLKRIKVQAGRGQVKLGFDPDEF